MVNPNFANEIVKNYRTQQERDNYTALFVQERANARDLGPGSDQFIQQMKAHEERQKALDEKFSQVMGTLNQPLPQPVNPQIDTGHLIALGLSALLGGGNQLPQNINYAQGQAQEKAKLLDQRNLQQFQLNKEDQLRLLQFLQQQLLDEQNFGQSLTRDQMQQTFQSGLQDKANARITLEQARDNYNTHPSERNAQILRGMGDPNAPTPQDVANDSSKAYAVNIVKAISAFKTEYDRFAKDGAVDESDVKRLEAIREKIAQAFDIKPEDIPALGDIHTFTTLAKDRETRIQKNIEWGRSHLTPFQQLSISRLYIGMEDARTRFETSNDLATKKFYFDIWKERQRAAKSELPGMQKDLAALDNTLANKKKDLARLEAIDKAKGLIRLFGSSDAKSDERFLALDKLRHEIMDLEEKRSNLSSLIGKFSEPIPDTFEAPQTQQPNWSPMPGMNVTPSGNGQPQPLTGEIRGRGDTTGAHNQPKNSVSPVHPLDGNGGLINRMNDFLKTPPTKKSVKKKPQEGKDWKFTPK